MSDDLDRLVRDLDGVVKVSPAVAREILQSTAELVKGEWKGAASTGRTASGYARKITYNTFERKWGADGEIGPRTGGRGSMGILDDPLSTGGIKSTPSRARRVAEKAADRAIASFGRKEVDASLREAGL